MNKRNNNTRTAPRSAAPDRAEKIAHTRSDTGSDASGGGSRTVRVLCVDDHPVLIEGLRTQFGISGRVEIVGRLPTAARLLQEVERLRPDGVLLDIEMPGPDAFESADRLKRTHPDVRIIVLSAHVRDAFITAAFRSGACAYFAKSDCLVDIETGIVKAMRSPPGSFVLGPKVLEHARVLAPDTPAAAGFGGSQEGRFTVCTETPKTLVSSLSPREVEVLRLIGKGLSRVQIAKELCRSAKTVDAHQARIMQKLGIEARADLMRFAIREGLAQA